MKKIILIYSFFILVSATSCSLLFNYDPIDFEDTENRKDIISLYNEDNFIYKTNRSFVYEIIKDSISKTKISNYIELKIIPGSLFKQTKIKYKFFNSLSNLTKDSSFFWELTGLIENNKNIWIHPPRSQYYELEFTAFPEIIIKKDNNKIKTKWKSTTYTGSEWGLHKNISITSKYNFDTDTILNFENINYVCQKIIAISTSKFGNTKSEFYFSNLIGFVQLNYFFKDETIKIRLIKITK
jgi:hypothetical protein